jgi:hypothetical protein
MTGRSSKKFGGVTPGASGLLALIFPPEPRSFPGRRAVKMLLRAAHVLCTGILAGGVILGAAAALQEPWLFASIGTGLLILGLDLHESGVFLLQVRGLVVTAKIAVLAAWPLFEGYHGWVLAALIAMSVLVSHATSKIRYFVVLGRGRLRGAETKG